MKNFWIYSADTDFFLGMVLAKDWVDARHKYAEAHGLGFGDVYACSQPLQDIQMFIVDGLFHLFALAFCTLDNYLQDRYWAKRGYSKYTAEDGQMWYVSDLD